MKIVVTGASGWIGRQLCAEIARRGGEYIALGRKTVPDVPPGQAVFADLTRDSVVETGADPRLAGAVALIHCAGHAHRPVETREEVAVFDAVNRQGSMRVLEIARRAGISRVVYVSSIAFYDWAKGCDFDESGPVAGTTAYARSKLAGEQAFVGSGLDWRVARLGTVFGEGDPANFGKMARALAARRFIVPGKGSAKKSVLPVALAGELLVDYALLPDPAHRLINLALPAAPPLAEICGAFVRACAFPVPKRLPLPLLKLMAAAGDLVSRVKADFPLTSTNLKKLTTSTSVTVKRMAETFPHREWHDFAWWLEKAAGFYRKEGQAQGSSRD